MLMSVQKRPSLGLLILQKLEILELHHMASLELLFLWTSTLLQTAWFMVNFITKKKPKSLQSSKVRNSQMDYLQCPEFLAQYFRKLEWPLLYTHSISIDKAAQNVYCHWKWAGQNPAAVGSILDWARILLTTGRLCWSVTDNADIG